MVSLDCDRAEMAGSFGTGSWKGVFQDRINGPRRTWKKAMTQEDA
jgi:hypothetical protein